MNIQLKRGNTIVKELSSDIQKVEDNHRDDYSNILNVRVNRRNTLIDNARISHHKDYKSNKQIQVPITADSKNIEHVDIMEDTPVSSTPTNYDATSKFIPKSDNDYLDKFGLKEEDFEEPKEDNNVQVNMTIQEHDSPNKNRRLYPDPSTMDNGDKSIEEKYSEYVDEDFENFEKMKKKRNIDNY